MQDGTISDGQISASSARRKDFGPANARLNFSGTDVRVGAWVAGTNDKKQWLQVDFGNETTVTAIDTQGRTLHLCAGCSHWVKEYKVSYSLDNATFHPYEQNGRVKVQCWEISCFGLFRFMGIMICQYLFFFFVVFAIQRYSRPTRTETPSSVTCWVPPLWRGTSASILPIQRVASPWGWSSWDTKQVRFTFPPISIVDVCCLYAHVYPCSVSQCPSWMCCEVLPNRQQDAGVNK